jgi:hypothetical protein
MTSHTAVSAHQTISKLVAAVVRIRKQVHESSWRRATINGCWIVDAMRHAPCSMSSGLQERCGRSGMLDDTRPCLRGSQLASSTQQSPNSCNNNFTVRKEAVASYHANHIFQPQWILCASRIPSRHVQIIIHLYYTCQDFPFPRICAFGGVSSGGAPRETCNYL